jgi:hypothetical protein
VARVACGLKLPARRQPASGRILIMRAEASAAINGATPLKERADLADVEPVSLEKMSQRLSQRAERRRAGYRARAMYRRQRKAWLRAQRRVLLTLALAGVLLLVALHWYLAVVQGDQKWIAGCVTGIFIATFIGLRHSPPGGITNWQEGAWGEELTASELESLPAGKWTVIHDLSRHGRFNFDHVVMNDRSVFCLNSKWSTGRLQAADPSGLHIVNRYDDDHAWTDRDALRRAKAEAADLSDLIRNRTGQRCWVEPVVVWWGPYPDGAKSVDGVRLVQGRQLVERLQNYHQGRGVDRQQIAAALRPGRRRAKAEAAPSQALASAQKTARR